MVNYIITLTIDLHNIMGIIHSSSIMNEKTIHTLSKVCGIYNIIMLFGNTKTLKKNVIFFAVCEL